MPQYIRENPVADPEGNDSVLSPVLSPIKTWGWLPFKGAVLRAFGQFRANGRDVRTFCSRNRRYVRLHFLKQEPQSLPFRGHFTWN